MINNENIGEQYANDVALVFKPSKIILEKKTKYQDIKFVQTETWGKILFIDNLLMKAEKDGHIINEMIVHPIMQTGKNEKKKVLIIGGGEGWTATELLKYSYIEKIDVVDIDEEFVNLSKEMFPEKMKCLNSSKVNMIISDGLEYIKNTKEMYDVIFVTPTDPLSLSCPLFSDEFIEECYNHLTDEGIYQVDAYMPYYKYSEYDYAKIKYDLSKKFKITKVYTATIPTFPGGLFAFCIASKCFDPIKDQNNNLNIITKYYNYEIHKACFSLPQFMLERIDEEIKNKNK